MSGLPASEALRCHHPIEKQRRTTPEAQALPASPLAFLCARGDGLRQCKKIWHDEFANRINIKNYERSARLGTTASRHHDCCDNPFRSEMNEALQASSEMRGTRFALDVPFRNAKKDTMTPKSPAATAMATVGSNDDAIGFS